MRVDVYNFYKPNPFTSCSLPGFALLRRFPSLSVEIYAIRKHTRDWQQDHIQFDKGVPQKGLLDT